MSSKTQKKMEIHPDDWMENKGQGPWIEYRCEQIAKVVNDLGLGEERQVDEKERRVTLVSSVVSDIRHFCHVCGISWSEVEERSRDDFLAEKITEYNENKKSNNDRSREVVIHHSLEAGDTI